MNIPREGIVRREGSLTGSISRATPSLWRWNKIEIVEFANANDASITDFKVK